MYKISEIKFDQAKSYTFDELYKYFICIYIIFLYI